MLEISIVKSKTGILLREITVLLLSVLATKCSLRYFLREDIKLDGRTYLSTLKKKKSSEEGQLSVQRTMMHALSED